MNETPMLLKMVSFYNQFMIANFGNEPDIILLHPAMYEKMCREYMTVTAQLARGKKFRGARLVESIDLKKDEIICCST